MQTIYLKVVCHLFFFPHSLSSDGLLSAYLIHDCQSSILAIFNKIETHSVLRKHRTENLKHSSGYRKTLQSPCIGNREVLSEPHFLLRGHQQCVHPQQSVLPQVIMAQFFLMFSKYSMNEPVSVSIRPKQRLFCCCLFYSTFLTQQQRSF